MPVGIINLTEQINLTGHTLTNKLYNLGGDLKFGTDYLLTSGTNILDINKGGTGNNTYVDGELLIGNSSGNTLSKSTLTGGDGITITNAEVLIISGAGGLDVTADTNTLTFTVGNGIFSKPIPDLKRSSINSDFFNVTL